MLNAPVTRPSAPTAKFNRAPLPLPSCWVDEVLLGAATWLSKLVVPSNSFQSKDASDAPSENEVMAIPVTSAEGLVKTPLPSNVREPVFRIPVGGTGVPPPEGTVALRSAVGMVIE